MEETATPCDLPTEEYGGHDYDFVEKTPDRLICKICHLPSRDPYLSVCCGHTYCKSCLDAYKLTASFASKNSCPVCRATKNFVTFPQKEAEREILSLHIYCTNKEKGCKWQGELNNINNHLGNSDGCQFKEAKCPNECGKIIERRYLIIHVETECPCRKVNCQYCHDTGEHQLIRLHKKKCPKLPIPCPNKCEVGNVPRDHLEAHRQECPLEMIQCEYHNVGCEIRILRKDQEKHDNENMKKHLKMTKHKLSELNNTQHQLMDTLKDTKAQLSDAVGQIINLTVLMNAQLTNTSNAANIRPIHLDSMVALFKFNEQSTFPITVKVPEYDNKKKDEIKWFSDSFYTHNNGYKMCLRVDAAGVGDGKGTHLSVYLHIMKGPHDDELTWPLKRKFVIKLYNQISDTLHYQMALAYNPSRMSGSRVTEGDIAKEGLGSSRFILNKDLCKYAACQYLKDDCLFFQVA